MNTKCLITTLKSGVVTVSCVVRVERVSLDTAATIHSPTLTYAYGMLSGQGPELYISVSDPVSYGCKA